jgi:hypothetical protein
LTWLGVLLAASSLRVSAADDPPKDKDQPAESRPAARPDDEKQIRVAIDAFAQAFLKADAKAIAELFTEDGEAVGAEGGTIQGREALEEHYAARFADGSGDKIETTLDSIKFLDSGVARETETGTNRGLCGGLLGQTGFGLQAGIPALERVPEVVVQDPRPDLEQEVRSPLGPAHPLLLDYPPADHLVHRRFRERCRNRLAVTIPVAP